MASDRHAPGRRTDGLEDRIVAALVQAQSEGEPDVAEQLLRALETLAARESEKEVADRPAARARDEVYLAMARAAAVPSELDRKIAELTAIRNAIADLAERCHGDDRPDCPILDELEATAH